MPAPSAGNTGQVGPSLRGEGFLVRGRLADGGGKTTHSVEGIFFDALQAAGLFEVRPVKIDAVTDQLGHGDAFSHGLALQPTQLLGMDLNLCAFHRLPQ